MICEASTPNATAEDATSFPAASGARGTSDAASGETSFARSHDASGEEEEEEGEEEVVVVIAGTDAADADDDDDDDDARVDVRRARGRRAAGTDAAWDGARPRVAARIHRAAEDARAGGTPPRRLPSALRCRNVTWHCIGVAPTRRRDASAAHTLARAR
jgi:hypothetical protein